MEGINKDVSILYLNIRSLANKFDELESIVNFNKDKFSIIILTETWLSSNDSKFFNLKNYNAVHSCRETRGGGVTIYIHTEINYDMVFEQHSVAHNIVSVKLQNELQLVAVYRSPKSDIIIFIFIYHIQYKIIYNKYTPK